MLIAFSEVGRQAIYADPNWQHGNYYGNGRRPDAGLAIARMIGHITYLSDQSMHEKFGRRLQDRAKFGYEFETEFEVESYLKYKGLSFTQRFDANSYLYVTKALDYFDLSVPAGAGGSLRPLGARQVPRRQLHQRLAVSLLPQQGDRQRADRGGRGRDVSRHREHLGPRRIPPRGRHHDAPPGQLRQPRRREAGIPA